MRQLLEESNPILDMEIPVLLKTRELIRISQILRRNYEDEEGLRETLGPILQNLAASLDDVESDPRWANLQTWDGETELLDRAVKKLKKHLKRIKKALYKGRSLRISYCTPGTGEVSRITITPIDLWVSDSVWMLRAYCYHQGEECTYLVGRMLKVKSRKTSEMRPPVLEEWHLTPLEAVNHEPDADSTEGVVPLVGETQTATDPDGGHHPAVPAQDETPAFQGEAEPSEDTVDNGIHRTKRQHGLPGKIPHREGLPHRLEQLVKRADRHLP